MMAFTIGVASGIEILQFVVAIIGFALEVWRLFIVVDTALEVVDAPPEDPLRLIAKITVRAQMNRVGALGLLVVMGLISVLMPPPPWEMHLHSEQASLIRIGLMMLTLWLAMDAAVDQRQRHDYKNKVDKALKDKEVHEVAIIVNGKTTARGTMAMDAPTGSESKS